MMPAERDEVIVLMRAIASFLPSYGEKRGILPDGGDLRARFVALYEKLAAQDAVDVATAEGERFDVAAGKAYGIANGRQYSEFKAYMLETFVLPEPKPRRGRPPRGSFDRHLPESHEHPRGTRSFSPKISGGA
jgi:hypothetical protein